MGLQKEAKLIAKKEFLAICSCKLLIFRYNESREPMEVPI
jgi:hypothetical protein